MASWRGTSRIRFLRLIDLARALASDPIVLMLDEIHSGAPGGPVRSSFVLVRRWRERGNSAIPISHRMAASGAALCDRATVLRDGLSVGVADPARGSEDRIVRRRRAWRIPHAGPADAARGRTERVGWSGRAALRVWDLCYGNMLRNVSSDLRGRDSPRCRSARGSVSRNFFDCIAGVRRHDGVEIAADGRKLTLHHPGDAIAVALCWSRDSFRPSCRSVRSGRTSPCSPPPPVRNWVLICAPSERRRVAAAVRRLQIDARAGSEPRRLSGGNQQKVVIAVCFPTLFQTLLCFDPTWRHRYRHQTSR